MVYSLMFFRGLIVAILPCLSAALLRTQNAPVAAGTTGDALQELTDGNATSQRSPGSSNLRYLVALQAWQRATQAGLDCPKPRKCECFCDCVPTQEEDMPEPSWPEPPCIPTTPAPLEMDLPPYPNFPGRLGPPIQELKLPWGSEPGLVASPSAAEPGPADCPRFYIPRKGGTCEYLTADIIREARLEVSKEKRVVDNMRKDGVPEGKEEFIKASDDYRRAVEWLLKLMDLYGQMLGLGAGPAPAPAGDAGFDGWGDKEFVTIPDYDRSGWAWKEGPAECEQWTRPNATMGFVEHAICGIMCRQDEVCKGFTIDRLRGVCIWFTNTSEPLEWKMPGPAPAPAMAPAALVGPSVPLEPVPCTLERKATYVKVRCIPSNIDLVTAIKKVHIFEQLLTNAMMRLKEIEVALDTGTAVLMTDFELAEQAQEGGGMVVGKSDQAVTTNTTEGRYEEALKAVKLMKVALAVAMSQAFDLAYIEAAVNPPIGLPPLTTTTTTTTVVLVTTTVAPHLRSLFAWAKRHPNCPRGPPCVCNCGCRNDISDPEKIIPGMPDFLRRPIPKPCENIR